MPISMNRSLTEAMKRGTEAANRSKQAKAEAAKKELLDGYKRERQAGREDLQSVAKQPAAQATAPAIDPFWAQKQQALVGDLEARAKGEGPSLAQMQFQQAGNTALQKSLGAIRAATGANPALAGRTAALATTNLMGNLAAESGMARLREQQEAQGALANLLAQGQKGMTELRGQDVSLAQTNADLIAKNQALQAGIQSGLLEDTSGYYGGFLNREAQIEAARMGRPSSKSKGLFETILPIAATAAATYAGGPGAGAATAAATNAVQTESPSGYTQQYDAGQGMALTGRQPTQPNTKKPSYALNPRRGR
jgi:hypothetical protein